MKKLASLILILVLTVLITGCDKLPDDAREATEEYCLENPEDVICDGFDTTDAVASLVNEFFNAIINDYNDDTDGFDCDGFFNETLSALCTDQPDYFAPELYTSLALVDFNEATIVGSDLGYELETETNLITDFVTFTVGLKLEDNELKIDSWNYLVIDNPNYTSLELTALRFVSDYNDKSLDNSVVCNKWLSNSIDASNCAMIRRTRLSDNSYLEFVSVVPGEYNIATYNLKNANDENRASEKYVVFTNNKLSDASWEFRITDPFNTDSYGFANNFINSDPDFHDACDLLETGVFECKTKRTSYLNVGIVEMVNVAAYANGFLDGYVTFSNIFSFKLEDDSIIQIHLECKIVNGNHEYEIINYYD